MTMRIDNASWGKMNYARHCLKGAKSRKALHAKELEQLRLAMEYMRGLRHWLWVASSEKKLKDRKAELARHIERIDAMAMRRAAIECCELNLVGDSCQSNIRAAMTWATTTTGANSFKDWDECVYNVNACIADALVQLDVVLCRVKSSWRQAKSDMSTARTVIDTCAKDILHPVALPKAVRKEMVRKLVATVINDTRAPIRTNSSLYFYANLVHIKAQKKSYGFSITYAIWNRALDIRSMYPR